MPCLTCRKIPTYSLWGQQQVVVLHTRCAQREAVLIRRLAPMSHEPSKRGRHWAIARKKQRGACCVCARAVPVALSTLDLDLERALKRACARAARPRLDKRQPQRMLRCACGMGCAGVAGRTTGDWAARPDPGRRQRAPVHAAASRGRGAFKFEFSRTQPTP